MSLSGVQTSTCSTAGSVGEPDARRGDRVVRLELDHRPDDEPERPDRVLDDRELVQQLGRHPERRLVAREHVVPERLDDVVRGAADVGRALLAEEVQQLVDDARRRRTGSCRRGRASAGAARSGRGTARRSRRRGGRARLVVRAACRSSTRARSRRRASRSMARVAVAGLQVDRGDRVLEDLGPEAELDRVERRRADAVVRRQADDDHALDAPLAEQALELRGHRLAGRRVLHREAGVAVLAVRALPDRRADDVQRRVERPRPRSRRRSGPARCRRPSRNAGSTRGASPACRPRRRRPRWRSAPPS